MRQRRAKHDASSYVDAGVTTPAARAAGDDAAPPSLPGSISTKLPARTASTTSDPVVVPIVLAAMVMGVYVKTLYPSVAGGDSGELVAESCHLGISHPPGYPLFNMLVYVVTSYLPGQQSKAWKANAFSAACDALAVVVMYKTLLLWTSSSTSPAFRKTAAFTASALFAFSPLIWTYAVGAEVFALNNLFAAALVYTLLQFSISRTFHNAMRGAFLCGLAMCNQHTIILYEIPIILWVLWTRWWQRQEQEGQPKWWKETGFLALAFLVGLLPYAYMPISAIWNPQPGSWGDVSTLSGFFHHLRRADYGTFKLFSTNQQTETLWTRLTLYSIDLSAREAPFRLAIPLAVIGLVVSSSTAFIPQQLQLQQRQPRKNKTKSSSSSSSNGDSSHNAVGRLVAVLYFGYLFGFHSLANLPLSEGLTYGVHMRFWQQPNVIVFLWVGLGLKTTLDILSRLCAGSGWRVAPAMAVLGRACALSLVAVQVFQWYKFCDQSQAQYIHNYALALLDPLPANAVLFVNFDLQWTSLRYLQKCENVRPDVTILNFSMMTYKWFATKHQLYMRLHFPGTRLVPYSSASSSSSDGFSFAQFLAANHQLLAKPPTPQSGGIFFGGKLNYDDADFHANFQFVPFGLLDEIQPLTAQPTPLSQWYQAQQKVRKTIQSRLSLLPPADKYDDQTWEWTIARDFAMKQLSFATFLLEKTISEDPHNVSLLVEATHAMEHSFQFEPQQFWNAAANLKNLGLAYAQIVKSNQEFQQDIDQKDPFFNAVIGQQVLDQTKYKDRASSRMLQVWDTWLDIPEARNDPAFAAIESVVRKFVSGAKKTSQNEPTKHKTTKTKNKKKTKKQKKKSTTP